MIRLNCGLVVEQSHVSEGHGHIVFVAGLDDIVVTDAAAGLCDVLHATLVGALDVVAEGEESVGAQTYVGVLGNPFFLLSTGEDSRLLGEELLPCAFAQYIVVLFAEVDVDGVVAVGTADTRFERKVENLRALAQPPLIGLVAGETCAVDAALLTGSDADSLSVLDIADAVALCIFQCDEGNLQVADRLRSEVLVLRRNLLEEFRVVEIAVVAALLKGDAEDLLVLDRFGYIVRVDLDDAVSTLALGLEDFQGFGCVVGCDDAVADLTLDESGGSFVAGVAQCTEVAIGAHAVSTTGAGIGTGQGRKLKVNVIHEIDLLQRVAQWQTYGSSCRRYVLEAGGGGQAGSGLELFDQLPAVESVEEVDVACAAIDLSCRCEIETYGKGSEKLAETEIKRSKKVVAMGL